MSGIYISGPYQIKRILCTEMTMRAGCWKTGWEVWEDGKKWKGDPCETLAEAKSMCED